VGQTGPAGPQGPAGANGKVELVRCATLTKAEQVRGRTRHVTVEQCSTKLVSGPVSFTTSTDASASLTRSGIVYATGSVRGSHAMLATRRALTAGTYVLTERHGATTTRRRVAIR